MREQKIKQDKICIGENIRKIRIQKAVGQTELVREVQLLGGSLTRETLFKIERVTHHIYASQLKAIKVVLNTTYDELLKER